MCPLLETHESLPQEIEHPGRAGFSRDDPGHVDAESKSLHFCAPGVAGTTASRADLYATIRRVSGSDTMSENCFSLSQVTSTPIFTSVAFFWMALVKSACALAFRLFFSSTAYSIASVSTVCVIRKL